MNACKQPSARCRCYFQLQSSRVLVRNGRSSRRKILLQSIFRYLDCREYPGDFDKNDKTALRKRAEFFCVKVTKLYYKAGSKLQH